MGNGRDGSARGSGLPTYKWMWWSPVRALYSSSRLSVNFVSMYRRMSPTSLSEATSSLTSRDGVSVRVREMDCRWPTSGESKSMSNETVRMWEVWPAHPWTNLATDASWSWEVVDAMSLVSRRRRRKAVFPVACPATIREYPLEGPSGRAAMGPFREGWRACAEGAV